MLRTLIRARPLATVPALLMAIASLAITIPVLAQPSTGLLNILTAGLDGASARWLDYLLFDQRVAYGLWGIAALFQVATLGYKLKFTAQNDPRVIKGQILKTLAVVAAYFVVLALWHRMAGLLPSVFVDIGIGMTGYQSISASQLITQGMALSTLPLDPKWALAVAVGGPAPLAIVSLLPLTFILAYAFIAIQVITITFRTHLTIAVGPAFFPAGVFGPSSRIAGNWLRMSIQVGVEFLFLYLVVSLGDEFTQAIKREFDSLSIWWVFQPEQMTNFLIEAAITAAAYAYLSYKIPAWFANNLLNGFTGNLEKAAEIKL